MFPFVTNQLLKFNHKSSLAICCGWTPRKWVSDKVACHVTKINCIGQLYTAERGVDMMVRNLIAEPSIRNIVLTGYDRTGVLKQLRQFWIAPLKKNDDDNWQSEDIIVGGDIPQKSIEEMRESVSLISVNTTDLVAFLNRWNQSFDLILPKRIGLTFPPMRQEPLDYPAPDNAHIVRGETIDKAYLKILHNIMTFGKRMPTHYDQDSKEIMNLVSVITQQIPEPTEISEFMPFSIEHLTTYRSKLMSPEKDPNVTYTYGNRMRGHFGTDQIGEVVAKMTKDIETRSAVISLWDPGRESGGSPCLNHLWFRSRNGVLYMTATIRSNDMFFGWPENAYGLRYLQEQVRQMLLPRIGAYCDDGRLVLGDLVINSQSAHIYEDCWAHANKILNAHYRPHPWWDEKGQWTFEYGTDGAVSAAELFMGGKFITKIKGSPSKIRTEIAKRNLISDVGHALYVGSMLSAKKN